MLENLSRSGYLALLLALPLLSTASADEDSTDSTNATGMCGHSDTHNHTNPVNAQRSRNFPAGLQNKTAEECCAACQSDASCVAFVFGPGGKDDRDCWPLRGYASTEADHNRTLVVVNTSKMLDVVHDRVVKTFYPPASSVKSDRDAAEKVRSAINDH